MKFMLPIRNADEECFLINFAGKHHAYVNRCRHVPMAMDWIDNQFFAEEGRYLMCQTHNAYYEPASGECIAGPPSACGKFLYRVPCIAGHHREAHLDQDLLGCQRRDERRAEEIARLDHPLAFGAARHHLAFQHLQHHRQLGGRIRMRQRTADGAARARR